MPARLGECRRWAAAQSAQQEACTAMRARLRTQPQRWPATALTSAPGAPADVCVCGAAAAARPSTAGGAVPHPQQLPEGAPGQRCARERTVPGSSAAARALRCACPAPLLRCRPRPCASPVQVWLHDLLPAGLEEQPEASRSSTAELEGVARNVPAGRVHLASALVDTDLRRAAYQAPFVQGSPEPTAADAAVAAAPAPGPAVGGPGRPPQLQRLESATEEWSERELRKKTRKTGALRQAGEQAAHPAVAGTSGGQGPGGLCMRLCRHPPGALGSMCCPLATAACPACRGGIRGVAGEQAPQGQAGGCEAAAGGSRRGTLGRAQGPPENFSGARHCRTGVCSSQAACHPGCSVRRAQARRMPAPKPARLSLNPWSARRARLQADAEADVESDPPSAPAPPPRPLPQPAGSLLLTVGTLSLPGAAGADCFFVLKCGPFWGRSRLLPCSGKLRGRGQGPRAVPPGRSKVMHVLPCLTCRDVCACRAVLPSEAAMLGRPSPTPQARCPRCCRRRRRAVRLAAVPAGAGPLGGADPGGVPAAGAQRALRGAAHGAAGQGRGARCLQQQPAGGRGKPAGQLPLRARLPLAAYLLAGATLSYRPATWRRFLGQQRRP